MKPVLTLLARALLAVILGVFTFLAYTRLIGTHWSGVVVLLVSPALWAVLIAASEDP